MLSSLWDGLSSQHYLQGHTGTILKHYLINVRLDGGQLFCWLVISFHFITLRVKAATFGDGQFNVTFNSLFSYPFWLSCIGKNL